MKKVKIIKSTVIFLFYFASFFAVPINNQPITDNQTSPDTQTKDAEPVEEIVFGQTGSFSGSFKTYGEIIKNSINACFKSVNDAGGINGKHLRLESLDDKGKAHKAADNIKNMVKKNKIDMFLGCMGTRGVLKVLPLIKRGQIAMFFPWGGDEKLRQPDLSYIINGLGLIAPQTAKLIDHVVNELRLSKIGIFHSDGDFSKQNAKRTRRQLAEYGIKPIKTASYNRLTFNIKSPAKKLKSADPKVVICLATSYPTAKLINHFFEQGYFGTIFLGIDSTLFVGEILKAKGAKFSYTSCVPNHQDTTLPIVKKYQEDLKKYYPDEPYNSLSFAYFLQASIVVEAMKRIDGPLTKEKIISEIEKMKYFDLGGFAVNFDPLTRHAFGKNIIILKG